MDHDTLVKEVLSDRRIEEGRQLIETLNASGWPLSAAWWAYDSDVNRWQLVLVSTSAANGGRLAAYLQVGDAIRALSPSIEPLSLSDVKIVTPDDDVVRALQPLVAKLPPGSKGRFLPSQRIDRIYVEDAFLYPN